MNRRELGRLHMHMFRLEYAILHAPRGTGSDHHARIDYVNGQVSAASALVSNELNSELGLGLPPVSGDPASGSNVVPLRLQPWWSS